MSGDSLGPRRARPRRQRFSKSPVRRWWLEQRDHKADQRGRPPHGKQLSRPRAVPGETVVRPGQLWDALHPRTLLRNRYLLFQFTRREVVLRFRQTLIGIAWVVLQPLLTAALLTVVYGWMRSTAVTRAQLAPAVWAAVGWSAFNGCVSRGTQSIISNANLVRKAHFPRYMLPVSACAAVLVDMAVGLVFAFALSLWVGAHLGLNTLAALAALGGLFLLGLGITLVTSGVSAKYRDVQYVVPFGLQVLVFVSPIGYSAASLSGGAQRALAWNPLAGYLELVRSAMLRESVVVSHVVTSVVATAVALVIGMYVFLACDRSMADTL